MKRTFLLFSLIFLSVSAFSQNWKADWYTSLNTASSSGKYLPFWARTGHCGIMPVSSSGTVLLGANVRSEASNGLFMGVGANAAFSVIPQNPLSDRTTTYMLDRLYFTAGWKMLKCEIGLMPRERELGDLSVTGGNMLYTCNARNMPGINMYSDWIYFEKGHWFGIRGNLAHYQPQDLRYVSGSMIHNKSLAFKAALGRNVDFIMGLDHWAQWGGSNPAQGEQPATFKDFLRIFLAKGGGSEASKSDQMNVLGNHLGREFVRLNWRTDAFDVTFQYDKPFEDGSGTRLQNYPDGVWSLRFRFADRKAWVSEVVYELITTAWQSGPMHDRPATEEEKAGQDPSDPLYGKIVIGGRDGYFNNSCYRSGWTNYGRAIGLPLMIVGAPGEDGISLGFISNRVNGHHIGLGGMISGKVPYVFKATYTSHRGLYGQRTDAFFAAEPEPWQLSLALEFTFPRITHDMPIGFSAGVYGDVGKIYENSVGLTLRMFYRDSRRF